MKLCDGLSYRGWCEHCGSKFETVEKSRLLCDKCHDEICEKQHVDYSKFHRRVDVDESSAMAEE